MDGVVGKNTKLNNEVGRWCLGDIGLKSTSRTC